MKYARPEALILAALLATGAAAQDIDWPRLNWNPAAEKADAPGDLVLPVPCGGAMVFRPVDVPGTSLLEDQRVILGQRAPDRGFIESPRPEFLSGTFKGEGVWRYYMGKYEVTEAQHAAIMADTPASCPDGAAEAGSMPRTGVTPAEAMLAAERYSAWLRAEAADDLPGAGATGFVRLPSEAEWEFAARGGTLVGAAGFTSPLPPMDGPAEAYINHARTDAALDLVGLLAPNPLGLHDMLGNAAELTHDLFRMNHVGRQHGRAGAFVLRGGSYRTRLSDLHSGYRQEFVPVGPDGLVRDPAAGFRLMLSAPALPDRARLEDARAEWERLAVDEKVELGAEQEDPLREVETLADFTSRLDFAEKDEIEERLRKLGDVISASIAKQKEERARAAREMLRSAVVAALKLPPSHLSVLRCARVMKVDAAKYREQCAVVSADHAFNVDFYLDRLTVLNAEFSDELLADQAETLKTEFKSRRLSLALDGLPRVMADLALVRDRGLSARDRIESGWRAN